MSPVRMPTRFGGVAHAASHVEPNADSYWLDDMSPVGGLVFGAFRNRTEALGSGEGEAEG
jgi:hypothetical protein